MKLKQEFRHRLYRAYLEIESVLERHHYDEVRSAESLLPALFSLWSYMWMKSWSDLTKK